MQSINHIALVDMDNTLAGYLLAEQRAMAALSYPGEPTYEIGKEPSYVRARRKLLKNSRGFWRNLPKLPLGFQILDILNALGFDIRILTQAPYRNSHALTEKAEWCQEHVPYLPVNMVTDKSMVNGDVLVDDWPKYYEPWLEKHPKGLVVIPAHSWNVEKSVEGPNHIRVSEETIGLLESRLLNHPY